jgi:biopolymer transport protein ExbD
MSASPKDCGPPGIVADKNVEYGRVSVVMGALQRAGLSRVSLAVRKLE